VGTFVALAGSGDRLRVPVHRRAFTHTRSTIGYTSATCLATDVFSLRDCFVVDDAPFSGGPGRHMARWQRSARPKDASPIQGMPASSCRLTSRRAALVGVIHAGGKLK
jgi:hypothetical protein